MQCQKFAEVVHLLCLPLIHTPCFPCDLIHGNVKGSDTVNVVANTATIDPSARELSSLYWSVEVVNHAGSMSAIVFTEAWSLRGLAVHFAKFWHKCHLLGIVGRCTAQTAGDYMFTWIWIWNLLSFVPFGLLWAHKWEFLVLLITLQINVLLFWTKCSDANGGMQLTSGIQLPTHVYSLICLN